MKLKKLKTINEAIEDIAVSKEDYGTMGFVMADAIRTSKKNRERADAVMHEKIKELPNEDRFAHTKDKGTPEMKKMHLSEDAFQTIDLRNRGSKNRKYLREDVNINKLVSFLKEAYADLTNNSDAVWHYELGNNLYYVMAAAGNPINYDEEDVEIFARSYDNVSEERLSKLDPQYNAIIVGKIAVNVDSLQSDYDFDWYMPYGEDDGEVWNTEREFYKDENFDYVAKEIMSEYNKMKDLTIEKDGKIVEDEVVEESIQKVGVDDNESKLQSILNSPQNRNLENLKKNLKDGGYDIVDISIDRSKNGYVAGYSQLNGEGNIRYSTSYIITLSDGTRILSTQHTDSNGVDDGFDNPKPIIYKNFVVNESFLNETGEVDSKKCADILNNWIDWTEVDETGDVDFAIDQLRSLASEKQITEEEYDFIMSNWDDLLKEGLSCSNKDKKLEEGMKFGQSSYDDAVKVVIDYYRDHSAEDALESIFNEFQMINEDEAYKLVYSLAERVEEFVGEDLEDSQKYPIESPFDKKGGKGGLKATQKYPVESPMKKKDSQFVKAEQKAPVGLTESTKSEESVKIITELSGFEPWTESAIETWDKIRDNNKLETLDFMLEDMYPEGLTATQLNDLLRFDAEWVLDMVGLGEDEDNIGAVADEFDDDDDDFLSTGDEDLDESKKCVGKGSEYDIDVSPEEADKLAESLVNTINSLENN